MKSSKSRAWLTGVATAVWFLLFVFLSIIMITPTVNAESTGWSVALALIALPIIFLVFVSCFIGWLITIAVGYAITTANTVVESHEKIVGELIETTADPVNAESTVIVEGVVVSTDDPDVVENPLPDK